MPTRNVLLSDRQSHLLEHLVATGRFQNASEALRAGLRLLEREEADLRAIEARLAAGLQQARARDFAPGPGAEAVRRAFAGARKKEA